MWLLYLGRYFLDMGPGRSGHWGFASALPSPRRSKVNSTNIWHVYYNQYTILCTTIFKQAISSCDRALHSRLLQTNIIPEMQVVAPPTTTCQISTSRLSSLKYATRLPYSEATPMAP